MTISSGTRLGVYEIASLVGSGGMGDVYRARDTKLDRDVAIKVLPDRFTSDPDRLARFEREAKVLASLNHPHIAALYGMDESGGRHFLVMELVPGETLAERLSRGALTVPDALRVGIGIADALEAAHEKGIVHRDLKPANVKITPDDEVKVLDFGLARVAAADSTVGENLTHSPTLSIMATQAGMILGTAAYMSPEQAKGLTADHRSDVFSFGVVLYEMLTGRAPFQGDTAPDILASVLAREPDFGALPVDLNPRIPELLRRCLEKNPKKRWQAVGDVRAELETVSRAPRAAVVAAVAQPPQPMWRRTVPFAATAFAAAALAGGIVWSLRPRVPAPAITRFSITLPEDQQFAAPAFAEVALSPDGTQMVYAANQRLYIRSMSELTSRVIAGTDTRVGYAGGPFFSPDGRSVAFWSGQDAATAVLKRIDIGGGVAVNIAQTGISIGASWDRDGIVFGAPMGIMRVSPNGGQPQLVAGLKNNETAVSPQILPGGGSLLFTLATDTSVTSRWDDAQIVVQSLKSGARKTLLKGSDARYLSSGHLVYAVGNVLFAAPFDPAREELTGQPVPVVEGVQRGAFAGFESGVAQFSVSSTGSLAFVPAPAPGALDRRTLAFIDGQGGVEPLKLPLAPYEFPRISPDGRQVAFSIDSGSVANVWIYALGGTSSPRQLTFAGRNRYPVWTPDGERITYQSDREGDAGIFWQRADGATAAERLTRAEAGTAQTPRSWAPDGKTLLISVAKDANFSKSLLFFSLPDRKTMPFVEGGATPDSLDATFSPDGRWIVYNPPGQAFGQILAQPFPLTSAKYLVAPLGRHPVWSPDGKSVYVEVPRFRSGGGDVMAVPVTTQPTFATGSPLTVSSGNIRLDLSVRERQYDITRDGKRLLGVLDATLNPTSTPAAPKILVVLNWLEDVKQKAPVSK